MMIRTKKTEKVLRAVRIAKAVSTLAVVALPVMTAVGVIAGYGAYSLLKHIRRPK